MRNIFGKVLILLLGFALFECQKKEETISDAEKLTIDNQIAKININPQSSYDFCSASMRIKSLDKIASSPLGEKYLVEKQVEMLKILSKYRNDIASNEGKQFINNTSCLDYTKMKLHEEFPSLEIVTSTSRELDEKVDQGEYIYSVEYQFTLKEDKGWFQKDAFVTVIASTSGHFRIECSEHNAGHYKHFFETRFRRL